MYTNRKILIYPDLVHILHSYTCHKCLNIGNEAKLVKFYRAKNHDECTGRFTQTRINIIKHYFYTFEAKKLFEWKYMYNLIFSALSYNYAKYRVQIVVI